MGRTSHSQNQRDLVEQIFQEHRTEIGNVDWQGAFAAHPEWRAKLGWDNPENKQRAYGIATRLKKAAAVKDQGNQEPDAAEMKRKGEQVAKSETVLLPEKPSPQIHFCPSCGFNLSLFSAAFTVAIKHSPR